MSNTDNLPDWLRPPDVVYGIDGAAYPVSTLPGKVVYQPEIVWPIILERIANGDSLSGALRRLDPAPSYWWAKHQLKRFPDLKARYQQAVEDRMDRLVEELIELADSPLPENLEGPALSAWVNKLRLQIDVRKFTASKLKPRVYGERLDVAVTATQISITAALERARRRVWPSVQSEHLDQLREGSE